jgi:hypothetical protein
LRDQKLRVIQKAQASTSDTWANGANSTRTIPEAASLLSAIERLLAASQSMIFDSSSRVCTYVEVRVCAYVCACLSACVRVCVCACVRVCVLRVACCVMYACMQGEAGFTMLKGYLTFIIETIFYDVLFICYQQQFSI